METDRFYADFPAHPDEAAYAYACPSSMKPTQVHVPKGSINQVRYTPITQWEYSVLQ